MNDMLERMAARDEARREAIRQEIAENGTRWAAEEIDRLRQEVASLKRRDRKTGGETV